MSPIESAKLGGFRWNRCACRARILTLASSFLLTNIVAAANVKLPQSAAMARKVHALAQTAKLPPLGTHGPELRVWIEDVMAGPIGGFMITDRGVSIAPQITWSERAMS